MPILSIKQSFSRASQQFKKEKKDFASALSSILTEMSLLSSDHAFEYIQEVAPGQQQTSSDTYEQTCSTTMDSVVVLIFPVFLPIFREKNVNRSETT